MGFVRFVQVTATRAIARHHNVTLKAAALQFALAHPAAAIVIPGASRPARLAEDHAALSESIPAAFWRELREQQLVDPAAPLPIESFTNIRPSLPAPHQPQGS